MERLVHLLDSSVKTHINTVGAISGYKSPRVDDGTTFIYTETQNGERRN